MPTDTLLGRQVLERYRVVMPLGRGGMGVVYLGRTEGAAGFARPVVIKSVLPNLQLRLDIKRRLLKEAQILANLRHPNIVQVIDFGEDDGRQLMVLEHVNGYDLGDWRRYYAKKKLSPSSQLGVLVLIRVLAALQHAHDLRRPDGSQLPIVHRDISLSNILLSDDGQVKLSDFGIAHVATGATNQTQGSFEGKLAYAAPELLLGHPASVTSDLYSTAVVLYHMLSGSNPFNLDQQQAEDRILKMIPPPLASLDRDIPGDLSAVVQKALRKDPELRYQSAAEFSAALSDCLTFPEEDLQEQLMFTLRRDFYGDLPEMMGLFALETRHRAWKGLLSEPVRLAPASREEMTKTVALSLNKGPLILPVSTRPKQEARATRQTWLTALIAALVSLIAIGALFGQKSDASEHPPSDSGPSQ